MSTIYSLGPTLRDGKAAIFIQVQNRNPKIHVFRKTGLMIVPKIWKMRGTSNFEKRFNENKELDLLFKQLDQIRLKVEGQIAIGKALTSDQVKEIIKNVIYKEAIEEEQRRIEEIRLKQEEEQKMTLIKYFNKFYDEAKDGTRITEKGTIYTQGTLTSIKQAKDHFMSFEATQEKQHDFADINMDFYLAYTAYLNSRDFKLNTIGKNINWLKTIMSMAETEGYHNSQVYKDKRFKGARVEVDTIYLTNEDLDKIRAVDLSKEQPGYALARDIFMIGVWTAQRVSDYNNIKKNDIKEHKVRSIEDVDDPDNPGKTKPVIVEKVTRVIEIVQKKTGTKVVVPCSTELLQILEKYNFDVPHLSDQKVNDYMKKVAKLAKLDEMVRIESVKGGKKEVEFIPKHDLVHTHTARRTGATLMYLSGMELFDIMKITGHSTPQTLKKYIKADELEVVDKIVNKYDYFK